MMESSLASALSSSSSSLIAPQSALVVVFGRPGSGKTTVADCALNLLNTARDSSSNSKCCDCLGLDLDVCIPQWMKDNFAKGMYPTLKQRQEFATTCCDYVQQRQSAGSSRSTLVSFSFVNTDLRDIFRSRFPHAVWVLVDTTEEEANLRIQQREGHFYVGKPEEEGDQTVVLPQEDENDPADNSEWNFAPVDFPHEILDGSEGVEVNAQIVADIVQRAVAKALTVKDRKQQEQQQ